MKRGEQFVDGKALQLTLRELRAIFTSPRVLAALAVAAVIVGISGPFDTFADFGVAQRLVYWTAMVAATYAVGIGFATFAAELLRPRVRHDVLRVGLAGALAGVPVTLVVMAVNAIAYGPRPTLYPPVLFLYCTAISIGVSIASLLLVRPEASPAAEAGPPPILERIARPLRGRLLALSVEDHYVEVLTDRGRTLVLMRLADAMREVGSVAGLQVHRSHWVALDAVKRAVRSGGRVELELETGALVPVSRGFLPAVRSAGLIV